MENFIVASKNSTGLVLCCSANNSLTAINILLEAEIDNTAAMNLILLYSLLSGTESITQRGCMGQAKRKH